MITEATKEMSPSTAVAGTATVPADAPQHTPAAATPAEGAAVPTDPRRKWLVIVGVVAAIPVAAYFLVPWVDTALNTVSTDDAYVNGHVTFVAPRVSGQVKKVLAQSNMRVKQGDLLWSSSTRSPSRCRWI